MQKTPNFYSFLILLLVSIFGYSSAFYLPGIAPKDYSKNEQILVFANSLRSSVTELPYDFYHKYLHFPEPTDKKNEPEGLGAVLKGDRLSSTKFDLKMLENKECSYLGVASISEDEVPFIYEKIVDHYYFTLEVDDLPAVNAERGSQNETIVMLPMGLYDAKSQRAELFNFFEFTVFYHLSSGKTGGQFVGEEVVTTVPEKEGTTYRVVGTDILMSSRNLGAPVDDTAANCASPDVFSFGRKEKIDVHYYYSVKFVESASEWVHRWDRILTSGQSKIHWLNIAHSLLIVVFLIVMVLSILLRALHRDISRYNRLEASEEAQEETGWKLIHGDVFRTPNRYMTLSVFLGNGSQLFFMACVTLFIACLGFLSPSSRGSLLTILLVTYVLSGIVAGYTSAKFYKMFGGEAWKKNVLLTAFAVPGALFFVFVTLNFILVGVGSSAAVPFTTMLALIAMWFLVSVPLCFVGAFRAFKEPRIESPVKTNQIPRQVPSQVWYMRPIPSALMGGILPFGAIFVELYYIMSSIWSQQFYYVFGFLFIIGTILVLTCGTVSILMCYFQLCEEDYRWWWKAFFSSGTSGFYVFLNSIIYYAQQKTSAKAATFFIYFGWSLVMSAMFTLVTGFIGFVACLVFVRKIYGSIKID